MYQNGTKRWPKGNIWAPKRVQKEAPNKQFPVTFKSDRELLVRGLFLGPLGSPKCYLLGTFWLSFEIRGAASKNGGFWDPESEIYSLWATIWENSGPQKLHQEIILKSRGGESTGEHEKWGADPLKGYRTN